MEPKYLVDFSDAPNHGETSAVTPHELAYHLLSKINTKLGDAVKLMEFDVFESDSPIKDDEFCPRVKINLLLVIDEMGDEIIKSSDQLLGKTAFLLEGSKREFAGDCFEFIQKSPVKEYYDECHALVGIGYVPEFMPVNKLGEYSRIRQDELSLCVKAHQQISIIDSEMGDSYKYNISGSGLDMDGPDLSELVHLASVQAVAILDARRDAIAPSGA